MKYCMCSTWAKQHPVEHVLNIAKNLKLDGVELWDGHIDGFLSAGHTLDDLNQVLQSHGLECVVIAPYLNFIDPAMAEDTAATARKCMTYAAALHCGMVRIFLGDRSSYEIKKEQWEHCCGLLRQLAKEAEAMDLKLVLEIHNDQPTDTKEAVLKVLRLINSPALGLIFDGFNFYPSGLEMMDAYEPLKKYTVHYHFKNLLWSPHLCVPLDEGDADFVPLIRALKRDGYDGYISFEYFAEDPSEMIQQSKDWFLKIYQQDAE